MDKIEREVMGRATCWVTSGKLPELSRLPTKEVEFIEGRPLWGEQDPSGGARIGEGESETDSGAWWDNKFKNWNLEWLTWEILNPAQGRLSLLGWGQSSLSTGSPGIWPSHTPQGKPGMGRAAAKEEQET